MNGENNLYFALLLTWRGVSEQIGDILIIFFFFAASGWIGKKTNMDSVVKK